MQLALDKSLSSLDISEISIGVNRAAQSPQDFITNYSEGCQTDLVMSHDVFTETRKITLESSVQCHNESLEMYTQTESAFTKTKNVQTDFVRVNCFTQTDKLKLRNAIVQTAAKLYNHKCQQAENSEIRKCDSGTVTEAKTVCNKGTLTENMDVYDMNFLCALSNLDDDIISSERSNSVDQNSKEQSDSPPLTPDKEIAGPSSHYSFPFVSLFNPLAVMLPSIGTYNFDPNIICCFTL